MITAVQRRSKDSRDTGTRDRLLAAAQGCLRTRGLAHASSRAIADEAGANLGAITYYFGSKDQLVVAALAEELRDWLQPVLELLGAGRDPATRLMDAVNALNETFDEQRDRAPGLLEVFVHAVRDPSSSNPVARIWTDLRTQLAAVIAELRATGVVPTWVAPEAMAALILAVGAGTVVSATVEPDRVDHRAIAAQFASLLLAAGTAREDRVAQSDATTVDAYLAELPRDRRATVEGVRAVILEHLPEGFTEGMQYGMIGYYIPLERYSDTYNGQPLAIAALANQKRYISLYLMGIYANDDDAWWFREQWTRSGKRLDMGKSCVRFRKLDDVPLDVVGAAIGRTSAADFIADYERSRGAT